MKEIVEVHCHSTTTGRAASSNIQKAAGDNRALSSTDVSLSQEGSLRILVLRSPKYTGPLTRRTPPTKILSSLVPPYELQRTPPPLRAVGESLVSAHGGGRATPPLHGSLGGSQLPSRRRSDHIGLRAQGSKKAESQVKRDKESSLCISLILNCCIAIDCSDRL